MLHVRKWSERFARWCTLLGLMLLSPAPSHAQAPKMGMLVLCAASDVNNKFCSIYGSEISHVYDGIVVLAVPKEHWTAAGDALAKYIVEKKNAELAAYEKIVVTVSAHGVMLKPTVASENTLATFNVAWGDVVKSTNQILIDIARLENSCLKVYPQDLVTQDMPGLRLLTGTDLLRQVSTALSLLNKSAAVVLDSCHAGLCACSLEMSKFQYLAPITGVLSTTGTAEVRIDAFVRVLNEVHNQFGMADIAPKNSEVTLTEGQTFAASRNYFSTFEPSDAGTGWFVKGNGLLFLTPGKVKLTVELVTPFWGKDTDALVAGDKVKVSSSSDVIAATYEWIAPPPGDGQFVEVGSFRVSGPEQGDLLTGTTAKLQAERMIGAGTNLTGFWECQSAGLDKVEVSDVINITLKDFVRNECSYALIRKDSVPPIKIKVEPENGACTITASYTDAAGASIEVTGKDLDLKPRFNAKIRLTVNSNGTRFDGWLYEGQRRWPFSENRSGVCVSVPANHRFSLTSICASP